MAWPRPGSAPACRGSSASHFQKSPTHRDPDGRLDGAALIRPTGGGSSRLYWQDLEQQPFVFVAPPDSPETSIEGLIARYDWIQFDTSLTSGRTAASHLHRLSPGTRPRFELESIEAVLAMVSSGLGVSIIPRLPITLTVKAPVRQMPLGLSTPNRQIAFACRAGDADSRRVLAIRNAFIKGYGVAPAPASSTVSLPRA